MHTIPGIHLTVPARAGAAVASARAEAGRQQAGWSLGDWLTARIDTRRPLDDAVARDASGVTVVLEGYLTGIAGAEGAAAAPTASDLLRLYLAEGTACLARLRGSYTGLVLDGRTQQALLFNDRRASRPLFVRRDGGGSLHAGPEVAALARLAPALVDIDPAAVSQFIIFASYYGDRTLFPAIRRLPPASILTLKPGGGVTTTRHWQLGIDPHRPAGDDDEWVDQVLAGLDAACARLGRAAVHPVLLLSGGDSRAIAASLRRAGPPEHAASYGTEEGDDAPTARQVAHACGIPFRYWPLATDSLEAYFVDAARQSDSQAETIDSPMLGGLFGRIADTHDAFVQGDKSVYGRVPATAADAFEAAGIRGWAGARRFVDMLAPDVARTVCGELDADLARMRADGRHLSPIDLRDKLYFDQRLCNRQNGFTALKLRHMEQFRPWLDEDLVDLMMRLPATLRGDEKALVRRVTARAAPDLAALPYARKDSIPQSQSLQAALAQEPALASFIRSQFGSAFDDRLAALFRPGAVQALAESLVTGTPYPASGACWWHSLPGLWRLEARRYASDKVHPVRIVLRLLQLNLFLASLRPSTPAT